MTCIVGYIEKETETVHIAGDSAGVAGLSIEVRSDPKVFTVGPFIMGFTSSFRMGQILMSSKFNPPAQNKSQDDYDYMITSFIDEVRRCFKKCGFLQTAKHGDDQGGTFLVGYKGQLYTIESDFQVGIPTNGYTSVGCGDDLAKGAMHALIALNKEDITSEEMMTLALQAASHYSGGVLPPFNFVKMNKLESEVIVESLRKEKQKKKKKKKNKK